MKKYGRRLCLTFLLGCLMTLLAACVPQQSTQGNPTGSTNPINAQPSVTVPMPPTQTACPADGTARAAIMKPLALGSHQNVVYVYNEVPTNTSTTNGILKRYDAVTGQKAEIVRSGLSITNAQLSSDGQWVLFLSQPDPRSDAQHVALLQLVRLDGQGLQTLYCFPTANYSSPSFLTAQKQAFPGIQWSADQKSVLMTTVTDTSVSTITLLNITDGTLHTELKITDANNLYEYHAAFWLDNTHAYVEKWGRQGPLPPMTLYLLDTVNNKDLNGGDLKKVDEFPVRFRDVALDTNTDGSKLFVGSCLEASDPYDSAVSVEPAQGGTAQTIYHQPHSICILNMRVISAQSMLLLVRTHNATNNTFDYQVWKMNTDGSAQAVLTSFSPSTDGQGEWYNLNDFSQFSWSNVSRDNNMYVLHKIKWNTKMHSLLLGSLRGGAPKEIVTTSIGSVDVVGWTTD